MRLHHVLWHFGACLAAAGLATPAEAGDVITAAPVLATAPANEATVAAANPSSALANTGEAAIETPAAEWLPVDAASLDTARGGFTGPGGLTVSLGIDRMVSINGEVLARSSIDVAGLGGVDGARLRQAGEALSATKLIQNGAQNSFAAGDAGSALPAIVVQNSLNNQVIRTETLIRASVNSAALLNTLHFQGSLQDALARSVAPR